MTVPEVFASLAGVLSVCISGAVAWAVQQSSKKAREKELSRERKEKKAAEELERAEAEKHRLAVERAAAEASKTNFERDAMIRAKEIYEGSIDNLEESLASRDRRIATLEKEVDELRHDNEDQERQITELKRVLRLRYPDE